jgi:hypothetical protein
MAVSCRMRTLTQRCDHYYCNRYYRRVNQWPQPATSIFAPCAVSSLHLYRRPGVALSGSGLGGRLNRFRASCLPSALHVFLVLHVAHWTKRMDGLITRLEPPHSFVAQKAFGGRKKIEVALGEGCVQHMTRTQRSNCQIN